MTTHVVMLGTGTPRPNPDRSGPATAIVVNDTNAMTTDPSQAIIDLMERGALAQAAYVAAELRLADHLAAGPMQVNELALATSCHPPSLHRLLRALVTLEICIEQGDGAFSLGRSGSFLCSDNADSLQSRLLWFGRNQWAVWGQLLQTVRTGESARKRMTGSDGFGLLELDPSAASTFNMAMVQRTRLVAKEVARHHDFSGVRYDRRRWRRTWRVARNRPARQSGRARRAG